MLALITVFLLTLDRHVTSSLALAEFSSTLVLTVALLGLALTDGRTGAFGLRRTPTQGWGYWTRLALVFGVMISGLLLVAICVAWMTLWQLHVPKRTLEQAVHSIYWFCLYAPVVEETGYRMLLKVALLPAIGPWGTVAASGVIFGAAHVIGGNPGLDNLVAGFFLQWAYLRSGSILVPLAMHSAGNACALTSQVVNWSMLPDVI